MIHLDTQNAKQSNQYVELVTSLIEQSDQEKIAQKIATNLNLMKDDVIKFGNTLADVLATGEFKDADADVGYEGNSITFSLRSFAGHWVSITFNTDGKHEFFVSLNNNDVDLFNLNVDTIIEALKNYNKIQVVTATGVQLTNFYVQPKPEVNRENE